MTCPVCTAKVIANLFGQGAIASGIASKLMQLKKDKTNKEHEQSKQSKPQSKSSNKL
jgi:hypothetical protein